MNLSLLFAKRYIFAKKSHNVINTITWITIACIAVISCAMVIILSVFNGLSETIISQYNKFDAELKIEPISGKSFLLDSVTKVKILDIEGISHCFANVEEEALMINDGKQYLTTIKGVDHDYISSSGLEGAIIDGGYDETGEDFALFGSGVAYYLSLGADNYMEPVSVYTSRRGKISVLNPERAFSTTYIVPTAIFSLQQEFDVKYVVIPVEQARELLEYDSNENSYLGVYIMPNYATSKVKSQLKELLGNDFTVKDRFEQQEMIYQIMKSEKWAIFMILSFILIIAAFNIVSSMTMLIIEKTQDISILKSLGATNSMVRGIFIFEGLLMLVIGIISGTILGVIVCWIQKTFNLIKLQGEGTFIIDAYPIDVNPYDCVLIFATIMSIGLILVLYSVQRLKRHKILDNLKEFSIN